MKSVQGMVALFTLILGAVGACSSPAASGGSETNWVESCKKSEDCKGGSVCYGGLCVAQTSVHDGGTSSDAAGVSVESPTTYQTYTQTTVMLSLHYDASLVGEFDDACLFPPVTRGDNGRLPCVVVEAAGVAGHGCNGPGVQQPNPAVIPAMQQLLRSKGYCGVDGQQSCDSYTYCQLSEFTGSDLASCQNDATMAGTDAGYCYIDTTKGIGSIASMCPDSRQIRVHDSRLTGVWQLGAWCSDSSVQSVSGLARGNAPIGDPCVPVAEALPDFPGHSPYEVSVEQGAPECGSGVCIAANFSGRVSCPYGQLDGSASKGCVTTGPDSKPVTVPVPAQIVARPPSDSVYCSCRCAGSDTTATYCACPSGFTCTEILPQGISSALGPSGAVEGSYCLKTGTAVTDAAAIADNPTCDANRANCGPP